MLLIWIDDNTLHNMDNGVTYDCGGDYTVWCRGAQQHDDRNFKMNNIIATGESGKVFWKWLLKQSVIPMPRPEHLTPQPAPADDAPPILVDLKPSPVDDDGFNPHADNGGLWNSLDVRVVDEASQYHNRIGTVTRFYYDGDERLLVLSHIDVKFGKDAPVKLKPGQVIDIPF